MAIHLEVPFLVYQAEDAQTHGFIANKHSNVAREASAFLAFIAQYYDCLPEVCSQLLKVAPSLLTAVDCCDCNSVVCGFSQYSLEIARIMLEEEVK